MENVSFEVIEQKKRKGKYTSILLPMSFIKFIDNEIVRSLGYCSRSEFIRDAVREAMERYESIYKVIERYGGFCRSFVTVMLPVKVVEMIDKEVIDNLGYCDRSEFIRDAVRDVIKRYENVYRCKRLSLE